MLTYQSPHQGHLYHSGTHGTEPSSALLCLQEHTSGDYSKDKFRSKQDTNKIKSISKQVKNSQSLKNVLKIQMPIKQTRFALTMYTAKCI